MYLCFKSSVKSISLKMEIMRIDHIAIWVNDVEKVRSFYEKYFNLKSGKKYHNPAKQFQSYFLSADAPNHTRIELMHRPGMYKNISDKGFTEGYTHVAFSVGGKEKVQELTEHLRSDGYRIVGEPRTTGDGYYESIVEDPEGNWIEITE